jgi:EpsI family protein
MYAAAGRSLALRVLPALAYLYFAIPIWEQFVPLLQSLSVHATEAMLAVLGVPAHVSEYTVRIPAGSFNIVEGCSGKKYFMIALAIAYLAGFVNDLKWPRFLGLFVVAGALAILANWIRIVTVIYLGHVTNMQHYFVAVEHKSLGNAIFVVLLVIITMLARAMAPRERAAPMDRDGIAPVRRRRAFGLRLAVPLILLGMTLGLTQVRAGAAATVSSLRPLPLATGKWQGPLPPSSDWYPDYVKPADESRATYASADGTVELYANLYGHQRQGEELIYFQNDLAAPKGWRLAWDAPRTRLPVTGHGGPTTAEMRQVDGSNWLVAYVYDVGGWRTASEPLAQIAYGWLSMLGPVPASVIAMAAPCNQNCETARQLVATFWDDMSPRLLAIMPDGTIEQDSGLRQQSETTP